LYINVGRDDLPESRFAVFVMESIGTTGKTTTLRELLVALVKTAGATKTFGQY
jgi:hypothetical protein